MQWADKNAFIDYQIERGSIQVVVTLFSDAISVAQLDNERKQSIRNFMAA